MDEEEELTWREIIDDEGMEVGSNCLFICYITYTTKNS
jgi:hypothetical protein